MNRTVNDNRKGYRRRGRPLRRMKPRSVVDLFCGAGGASTGAALACEQLGLERPSLVAVNHWTIAVETHKLNHPWADHHCCRVESLDPRTVVPNSTADLIVAGVECFSADTLVLTTRGLVPISQVQVGDEVLTHRLRWMPVTETMRRRADATMLLKGHGHPGLRTTAEHPIWSRTRKLTWPKRKRSGEWKWSNPEWSTACSSKGRYWGTPAVIPSVDQPNTPVPTKLEFWWIVGRWLGDGWAKATKKSGQVAIACSDEESAELEQRLAAEGHFKWSRRRTRTAVLFTACNTKLARWLIMHFGRLAHGKTIPTWAFGMSTEARIALLDGYMSADGHFDGRKWEASTVSKKLAISIRMLAEGLGHRVALHCYPQHADTIEGRKVNTRDVWRIAWLNKQKRSYAEEIGGIAWSRIKEATTDAGCWVYNLSVANDESYVADGIIVHNCTHHSQARGGKPMSDQSRASAWSVLHWAEQLRAKDILIENVPEFMSWGPLNADGRPNKRRKGETFNAFIQALESLNYRVDWRIINAADYGDPQKRRRLFLRARANRRAIEWPEATHDENTWRTAREIIDWSDLGSSIFSRKRPLADRTVARIAEGIKRYCGEYSEAFLQLLHTGKVNPKALPAAATCKRPFLVPRYGERPGQAPRTHSIDEALPTVTGTNAPQLVTPFILPHDQWTAKNGLMVDSVDAPMRTVTAHNGRNNKLVTPFLLPYYRTGVPKSVDGPLDTVTTRDRFALVTPDGVGMDIYFRMLAPRELARAQSFPDEFEFVGNKGEQIKQIGNAVPVSTATALCRSVLSKAA